MGGCFSCFEDDEEQLVSRGSQNQRNYYQNNRRNNTHYQTRQPRNNRNNYNQNQHNNAVSNQPRGQVVQHTHIGITNQQRNFPSRNIPSNSERDLVPDQVHRLTSYNQHPEIKNAEHVENEHQSLKNARKTSQNEPERSINNEIAIVGLAKPNELDQRESLSFKILANERQLSKYLDFMSFEDCSSSSNEYKMIARKFSTTTQKHYKIFNIQKIFNRYLRSNYLLRKKEYSLLYGSDEIEEKILFHGTKINNVGKIASTNLDWRLRGKAKGHIFGQGVSFTPISNYASNYSDFEGEKVMFVFTVLVCKICVGTKDMVLPPICETANYPEARFDTSGKPNGHVLVKFRDDEFYPSYLIRYTGSPIQKNSQL